MKRVAVVVSGTIQNGGYRAKVGGLTGFIQNLGQHADRIIAEGEDGNQDKFLDAIRIKNVYVFS